MKIYKILAFALLFSLFAVSYSVAQDMPNWQAEPTFTTVNLTNNFTPDPHSVEVQAGGDSYMPFKECNGYIHLDAPDVDLNYEAGDFFLSILAQSQIEDVTLLVYAPDGEWYCSESNIAGGAGILFESPLSGNYNIWVGSYDSSTRPSTRLSFTETDEHDGIFRVR